MTKVKKVMDLGTISPRAACDKGFEFELRHPSDNEPLGAFITVTGKEGTAFQEHVREKANANLKRRFEAQRRGKEEVPTIEKVEKDSIALLVACTVSWRNIVLNGAELEFSEANARKLYAESWIRGQVDEAIDDLGNFMPT